MRALQPWPWIAAVLFVHLLLWVWNRVWPYGLQYDTVDSVWIAIFASEMSCLCVWGAFGPGGVFLALPSALTLAVLIWLAAVYSASRSWIDSGMAISLMMLAQCILVLPVAFFLRYLAGQRFCFVGAGEQDGAPPEEWGRQISLLQIMAWTAVAAGLCLLALHACSGLSWKADIRPGFLVVALVGIFNGAIGLSQLIPFLLPAPRLAQWAISVFAWFALCLVQVLVFDSFIPNYGVVDRDLDMQIIVAAFLMNTPQLALIWLTFGLLYLGGMRLLPNDPAAAGQSAGNGGR